MKSVGGTYKTTLDADELRVEFENFAEIGLERFE